MNEAPVLLYRARNRMEALLLQRDLEFVGIEAQMGGGISGELRQLGPGAMMTDMWVRREDLELAERVIDEVQRRADANGAEARPDWSCAACGEKSDAGFAICWNCQSTKG